MMLRATSTDRDRALYLALREIWSVACHSAADRYAGGKDYGWRLARTITNPGRMLTAYEHEAQGMLVEQDSRDGVHTITLMISKDNQ